MMVDISSSTRIQVRDNERYINFGVPQIDVIVEVKTR